MMNQYYEETISSIEFYIKSKKEEIENITEVKVNFDIISYIEISGHVWCIINEEKSIYYRCITVNLFDEMTTRMIYKTSNFNLISGNLNEYIFNKKINDFKKIMEKNSDANYNNIFLDGKTNGLIYEKSGIRAVQFKKITKEEFNLYTNYLILDKI